MDDLLFLLLVLIAVVAAFRLSILHGRLSSAYQLVADMLRAEDKYHADAIAEREMRRMKARRWWQ